MIELPKEQVELYKTTEEGKAYLEYNEKIGGEPFGYSLGCPDIDELYGGIPGLYAECIKQGKTWEELIGSGWDELSMQSQPRPSFFDSPYFISEPDNWHLSDDAPEELKKEFEEYMKESETYLNEIES